MEKGITYYDNKWADERFAKVHSTGLRNLYELRIVNSAGKAIASVMFETYSVAHGAAKYEMKASERSLYKGCVLSIVCHTYDGLRELNSDCLFMKQYYYDYMAWYDVFGNVRFGSVVGQNQ